MLFFVDFRLRRSEKNSKCPKSWGDFCKSTEKKALALKSQKNLKIFYNIKNDKK